MRLLCSLFPTNILPSYLNAVLVLLFKNYGLDTREKPWYEKVKLKPLTEEELLGLEKHNFT